MSESIDLVGLIEQMESAHEYQLHLEAESRRLTAELEETQEARDQLKARLANEATVPRVITADELRHGMFVAVADHGEYGLRWEAIMALDVNLALFEGKPRIVLLEDAPAEEPEPVKVGDTINTEEQLEGLPSGTILRGCDGVALERGGEGWWTAGWVHPNTSLLALSDAPLTVLYLPEEDA